MLLPEQGIRQRKKLALNEFVQEFDSFNKVKDEIQEEQSAGRGVYSVCCFILIFILCFGEIYDYWYSDNVAYKFGVDVDFDERPILDLDMIIASPCNSLNIMTVSQSDHNQKKADEAVIKDPSRFEMDDGESQLWETLKEAHQQQFQPGTKLKSLNDMSFVSKSLEQKLQSVAKSKVADEADEIRKQRESDLRAGKTPERDNGHQIVMMIGNGGGMFQLISSNRGPDEGTACRLHGKIPVLKGDGDKLTITSANSINLPGLFGALEMNGQTGQNFSHRIERFHFGDHLWGLVTPLSGTEKLSSSGDTMYKYFIKVVPTVIHHAIGKTRTYQYSVTGMQRDVSQSGHTVSGITFSYEFVANVIEVYPNQISFLQLLPRLCAVAGGIFATSAVLHTIFASISSFIKPAEKKT